MTKKQTKTAVIAVEDDPNDLVPRARASLGARLAHLEKVVGQLEAKMVKKKTYDRNEASHYAWLTKQISQITEAVSKMDARQVREADNLPDALVMLHLRRLPTDRKKYIIGELEVSITGERRSVLG